MNTMMGIKPLSTVFKDDFEQMEEWGNNHAKSASLPDDDNNERVMINNVIPPKGSRSRNINFD
jgi:hypothetical protein